MEDWKTNWNKSATLEDIAREVGRGLGTVSRALSGRGSVSKKTRAKVLEVAERLGYQPNAVARALAAQRAITEGKKRQMLLVYLRAPGPESQGFVQACAKEGAEAGFINPDDYETPKKLSQALIERGVDGILVGPMSFSKWNEELMRRFLWHRFAVVVLARDPIFDGFDVVRHSAFDYMRTALLGLRQEGFRKIQVILHRSVSPWDNAARLGAVLEFAHTFSSDGIECRHFSIGEDVRRADPEVLKNILADEWADVVLFDHFGFVGVLQNQCGDWGKKFLETHPHAASITTDANDANFGDVSGCPVNLPQMYHRAAKALFEKVQMNERGRSFPRAEYVIEPQWVPRASLRPKNPAV